MELGGKGYEFASSTTITKGCYSYKNGEYFGHMYYGSGGTAEQNKKPLEPPKFRPPGYDCTTVGNVYSYLLAIVTRVKKVIQSTLLYMQIINY